MHAAAAETAALEAVAQEYLGCGKTRQLCCNRNGVVRDLRAHPDFTLIRRYLGGAVGRLHLCVRLMRQMILGFDDSARAGKGTFDVALVHVRRASSIQPCAIMAEQ